MNKSLRYLWSLVPFRLTLAERLGNPLESIKLLHPTGR